MEKQLEVVAQVKLRARKIKEGRQRRETEEANSKLEEKQAKSKIQHKDDKESTEKNEQMAAATNKVSRRSRHSEQITNKLHPNEKFMEDETDDVTKGKRTRRDVGGGSSREVKYNL